MDALARTLFDLSPAGVILFRPVFDAQHELIDFTYDQLNQTAQQLLNLPAQPAQTFRQLYPHVEEAGIFAFCRDTFLSDQPGYYGVDYQHDGLNAYYQLAAHRAESQLVVTFTDAADRRQGDMAAALQLSYQREQQARAEAERQRHALQLVLAQAQQELETRVRQHTRQLTEQQTLLSRILGQMPAAIATLSGPAHHYSFANAQYQQLVSQRVELGKTVLELLPELAEQGFIDLLDHVYTSGEPYLGTEITVLLAPAGSAPMQHYFDFVYQPLVDGQGQTQGILVFALDVTEQVRTRRQASTLQAALLAVAQRQARERLELLRIFEHAPVAVALLREPAHRLDYFNELFEALFPGAQLGLPVAEAYADSISAATVAQLDHVYQSGETYQGAEMQMPNSPSEAPRYITLTYQAYREEDRIVGVAVFVYEVTDQVLARQQVQALNAELTASNHLLTRTNAELDSFVYTASHDLKAPIANLEGLLAALRQDLRAAAPVAHLLGLMEACIGRLQQTIGHLAEVARLSPGHELPTEPVDLAALLEAVRLDLATELAETGARFSVAVGACPRVQFAPQHLRSIVYNLLSNALRYRAPGRVPEVRLQATCTAGQLVLAVQDNGLGLDAEQQSKLFRLFKRLHSHVQGSGVGLYAVKKVVENAGGTIAVQSEAGVGSTFTVSLPLRPAPGQ